MADPQITTGGIERVPQATELLSKAFRDDPSMVYILSHLNSDQRYAYIPDFFRCILQAAAMNNATFDEINDWKSCGVLLPPGSDVGNPRTVIQAGLFSLLWNLRVGGSQRILVELPRLNKACKAKVFRKKEKYFYVFFLGTSEDARGQGLCSHIVRHYQDIARKEGMPIWLEAATEYCWKLYLKLGFVTVGEVLVGQGKAAADGTPSVGGPGVKLRGMIWRPEGDQ